MVTGIDERGRIRQALIDLSFERGFRNVTLEELLAEAGVDRAAFDQNFADLEDCFYEVYRGELERYRGLGAAARAGVVTWRDRIRVTAYSMHRFLAEDPKILNFTTVAGRGGGERVQLLIGEEVEALIDLVDEGRQELDDPGSLSRSTAESLAGGIFNRLYSAGSGEALAPEGELIPTLMYTIVLPYMGAEAAAEELATAPPGQS